MSTTYTDFLAQVRRELGEPVEGVWADISVLWWTNEAITDLSRQAGPSEDEEYSDSIIGVPTLSLPLGTTKVLSVFYDGAALTRTKPDQWTDLSRWEELGTPTSYIADDESIRLIPTPDAAKEIRFFRQHYETEIAVSDSMPWNSAYDTAIRYYVLRRAMEQVNDFTAANEYAARYADEVSKVLTTEIRKKNSNHDTAPREVW